MSRPGMVAHACNPRILGGWGRQITWGQEAEAAVSQDHAIAFQAGWQSKTSSKKKKKDRLTLIRAKAADDFKSMLIAHWPFQKS